MEVYFVRHGETDHNKKHLHQPAEVSLNELGRKQAESLRSIVEKLKVTHVIASNLKRAIETAEIATADVQLPIQQSSLFNELKRPDQVLGRSHFSFRSLMYMWEWFNNFDSIFWKKNGGESRLLFLTRIQEAKEYLESLPHNARVTVFSHSLFINFFIAHICDEQPIPFWKAIMLLLKIKKLDNSSISHLSYNAEASGRMCKWSVVSFDDDVHVVT